MKSRLLALLALAFMAGCASAPNGHHGTTAANDPNSVYNDPTYPGRGVRIGIGAGSWGGRSGGGVGIGMGW
jgi:starvation-inducible outer membrane lipoprotein